MDATTIAAALSLVGVLVLGIIDLVKSRRAAEFTGVSTEEKKQNMMQALIDKAMELNKQEIETIKTVNDELRKQSEEQIRTIEAQTMEIARLENVIHEFEDKKKNDK